MKLDELARYLVGAPLYQPKQLEVLLSTQPIIVENARFPYVPEPGIPVPDEVDRYCATCKSGTKWQWDGIPGSAEILSIGLNWIDYKCKNCGPESFTVWLRVSLTEGKVFVEKVGQHPKLQIPLPPDFAGALGMSKDMYIKGMASRHAGYGIGALGYIRRVIDDRIEDMLGLLETAMVETSTDPAAIDTVRRARAGKVFDEKVRLAAEAMPEHLKPGGMNPFAELYDAHSIGIHELSDEECCDIVDVMDEAMKYVYTELKKRTEGAAQYKAAATKIQQKVAELRARKEGQAGK